MPDRIMYVQLKTGYNTDAGPAWVSRVRFSSTWQTAYWHGRTLDASAGLPPFQPAARGRQPRARRVTG